ncbi:hypothetical protein DKX38_028943 [Salix brachista]|uniref:VQ domain-containing protein n=1 Tax=Salix brachista TaxID=2182728 RepID=A0A5N5J2R3_9ROSI|nr:hypothetical protein DKX38_028943 [Salix brachista]
MSEFREQCFPDQQEQPKKGQKSSKNKREPVKIKYISSPTMVKATSATEFRAIVQELTGKDSKVEDPFDSYEVASQVPRHGTPRQKMASFGEDVSERAVSERDVFGSAEVLYTRRSDAFGAFKKYNNVLLDGKPMKIEIVGANPVVPISARMNVTGANGKKKRTFAMIPGLGGGRGAAVNNRGFGSINVSVHSRHQGGGDISTGEKSVDELEKELESYHAEAMQT